MKSTPDPMLEAKEKAYMHAKLDATVKSFKRNGATILRYKPGTRIQDSKDQTYEVQKDGSWRRLGKKR